MSEVPKKSCKLSDFIPNVNSSSIVDKTRNCLQRRFLNTKQKIDLITCSDIKKFIDMDFSNRSVNFYLDINEQELMKDKPYKRKFNDSSLLSEALTLSQKLESFQIQTSIFKTDKKPLFDVMDLIQLVESIIPMENSLNDINTFEKRNEIFDFIHEELDLIAIPEFGIRKLDKLFKKMKACQINESVYEEFVEKEKVRIDELFNQPIRYKQISIFTSKQNIDDNHIKNSFNDLLNENPNQSNFNELMNEKFERSTAFSYCFCPFTLKQIKQQLKITRFNHKKLSLNENANLIQLNATIPVNISIEFKPTEIKKADNDKPLNIIESISTAIHSMNETDNSLSFDTSETLILTENLSQCIKLTTTNSTVYLSIDKDIMNIFYINTKSLLILTTTHESYLVNFLTIEQLTIFLAKLNWEERKFSCSKEKLMSIVSYFTQKWYQHSISSFRFISFLNLIIGRNYLDQDSYPIFPPPSLLTNEIIDNFDNKNLLDQQILIKENSHPTVTKVLIPNLSITEFLSPFNRKKLKYFNEKSTCVIPEIYFAYDLIDDVYSYRKSLELSSCINDWIFYAFGCNVANQNPLFEFPLESRSYFNDKFERLVETSLKTSIVYASKTCYDNEFIAVYESGEIQFVFVDFENQNFLIKTNSHKEKVKNPRNCQYFTFNTGVLPDITPIVSNLICYGLVVYDDEEKALNFYTKTDCWTYRNVFLENPLFLNSIFVRNQTSIDYISRLLPINSNQDILNCFSPPYLYNATCDMKCIASSDTFPIFVIGRSDCKVTIISLTDGNRIQTVDLMNEVPIEIIITDCWGLILVKTIQKLFLLSENGKILKVSDNFPQFKKWFSFHNSDDFDFIVLIDTFNRIQYFEAYYPDQIQIFMELKDEIELITYDKLRCCFLVVTHSGKMMIFPSDLTIHKI